MTTSEFTWMCFLIWRVFVQCYWRAYSVGDVEKMALLKLAKWVIVEAQLHFWLCLHTCSVSLLLLSSLCQNLALTRGINVNAAFFFFFSSGRLHEQLNESDDAAQCYMLYIQDIFSCGVSKGHSWDSGVYAWGLHISFHNQFYKSIRIKTLCKSALTHCPLQPCNLVDFSKI